MPFWFALSLPIFAVLFHRSKNKKKAMSIFSYHEHPTLDEVRGDIAKIIGLTEIKLQLETIVEKIVDTQQQSCWRVRIVPPKPFHMVFVGNSGTGKSMVAEILGKLFYIAGTLQSYSVTTMEGLERKIKTAEGGIMIVDANQNKYDEKILEEIISLMDENKTLIIFAGTRKRLNKLMMLNKDLYQRFTVALQFNNFSCEELARMLHEKMMNEQKEDKFMQGFKLDSSITVNEVANVIAKETFETLRQKLNGYLVNQMLADVKDCLKARLGVANAGDENDQRIIFLDDIVNGVRVTTKKYKDFLLL